MVWLAGTRSRLYVDNGPNWTLLASEVVPDDCAGPGVPAGRWNAAQTGNTVFLGHTEERCYTWSPQSRMRLVNGRWLGLDPVADLIALGISRPQAVASCMGFTFIANVVEEGVIRAGRLFWSDAGAPAAWLPGGESLAGFVDLGEAIIALAVFDNRIRVYTYRSIWDGTLVGGDEVWRFTRRYEGDNMPAHPRAVVSTGGEHLWIGRSRVWKMGLADYEPIALEWLDDAAGAIFKGVAPGFLKDLPPGVTTPFCGMPPEPCHLAHGWWSESRRLVCFSWATDGLVNDRSLFICPDSQGSCVVDAGFTAGCEGAERPAGSLTTAQFFRKIGLCPLTVGVNEGQAFEPEGSAPLRPALCLVNPDELTPGYVPCGPGGPDCSDCWCSTVPDGVDTCWPCPDCAGRTAMLLATPEKNIVDWRDDYFARDRFDASATGEAGPWNQGSLCVRPDGTTDAVFPPEDHPTSVGVHRQENYASLWQLPEGKMGTMLEKSLRRVGFSYDAGQDACRPDLGLVLEPWTITFQSGAASTPVCLTWWIDDPQPLRRCNDPVPRGERDANLADGVFAEEGVWMSARGWVGSSTLDGQQCGALAVSGLTLSVLASVRCRWP